MQYVDHDDDHAHVEKMNDAARVALEASIKGLLATHGLHPVSGAMLMFAAAYSFLDAMDTEAAKAFVADLMTGNPDANVHEECAGKLLAGYERLVATGTGHLQ